jgi:SPP1 gp7 family putative phage head morphogenesis protein
MPNVVEDMEDETIKHQVFILRLEKGQTRDMVLTIDSSTAELTGALAIWLQDARKGQQVLVLQDKQFDSLARQVRSIRGAAIAEADLNYRKQLTGVVAHEIEWADDLFRSTIPVRLPYAVPDASETAKKLINRASYEGATLQQWFNNMAENDFKRIMSTVRFGVTQGLSNQEIIQSVVGTRELNFTDGVVNTTRNDAARLVRTITNGMANDARSAFYLENAELLIGERYTATLDGRTSLICASLDGTIVPVGGEPRPPQHPNCRSTMTPIVDDKALAEEIGERPFVRDTRTRRMREIDFRQEAKKRAGGQWKDFTRSQRNRRIAGIRREWVKKNVGQVAASTTYEQWLKRQPTAFQNEVLGPTRAKMWRSGKADLGDFVDRSGKVLNLDQLKKLEG